MSAILSKHQESRLQLFLQLYGGIVCAFYSKNMICAKKKHVSCSGRFLYLVDKLTTLVGHGIILLQFVVYF